MFESLACGTPVIASPQGAAPEIVYEGITGFLRNDEEALATALTKVGQLDRAACRASADKFFSANRMVDDHLAFFADILEGRFSIHMDDNDDGGCGQTAPRHIRPVRQAR